MSSHKWDPSGGDRNADQVYEEIRGFLTVWDMSAAPSSNDLVAKLGSMDSTRGAVKLAYDDKKAALADAIAGPMTLRPLDPDNWIPRWHEPGGTKKKNVTSIRLSSDYVNKGWKRESRGTMVIGQCSDQSRNWAWLQDLGVPIRYDAGTKCDDAELAISGAGFFAMLAGEPTGTIYRSMLARNIAKNQGWSTDTELIGQDWQNDILVPLSKPKKAPDRPDTPTPSFGHGTDAEKAGRSSGGSATPSQGQGGAAGTGAPHLGDTPGSTVAEEGTSAPPAGETEAGAGKGGAGKCGKGDEAQRVLRGDYIMRMGEDNVVLSVVGAYPTKGDVAAGFFYKDAPIPAPPDREMALDKSTNHKPLRREYNKGLCPWVLVPQEWCPPPWSNPVPSGWPGVPAALLTPILAERGVQEVSSFGPGPTYAYGLHCSMDLPDQIAPQKEIHVSINFVPPASWAGGQQIRLQCQYVVTPLGNAVNPGAVTGTLTNDLVFGAFPNANGVYRAVFTVPNADIASAPGGKLAMVVFRRGDQPAFDTAPGSLDVVGIWTHFGDPLVAA